MEVSLTDVAWHKIYATEWMDFHPGTCGSTLVRELPPFAADAS